MLFGTGAMYGQATKFVITGSGTQIAGTTQNLTIRADSAGSPAASYTGSKDPHVLRCQFFLESGHCPDRHGFNGDTEIAFGKSDGHASS